MNFHMSFQFCFLCCGIVTKNTSQSFENHTVVGHVLFQILCRFASVGTKFAKEWFNISVNVRNVVVESGLKFAAVRAVRAREGLVLRMAVHIMLLKVIFLNTGVAADGAHELFNLTVSFNMSLI